MNFVNFTGKRYGKSSYILTFSVQEGEFGVRVLNPNDTDEKTTVFYCFGIHSNTDSELEKPKTKKKDRDDRSRDGDDIYGY